MHYILDFNHWEYHGNALYKNVEKACAYCQHVNDHAKASKAHAEMTKCVMKMHDEQTILLKSLSLISLRRSLKDPLRVL